MALANAKLPDGDRRKLTRLQALNLHAAATFFETGVMPGPETRAQLIVDVLRATSAAVEAILPPPQGRGRRVGRSVASMTEDPDFAREDSLRRLIQKMGEALRRVRARLVGKVAGGDATEAGGGADQATVTLTSGLGEVEWLDPWQPTAPGLETELAREVGPGHVLAGRRAVAVARRIDDDDVLFYLPDGPASLAVVHLTWTGHRERKPEFPWTVLYHSVADFAERCMRPDHDFRVRPRDP